MRRQRVTSLKNKRGTQTNDKGACNCGGGLSKPISWIQDSWAEEINKADWDYFECGKRGFKGNRKFWSKSQRDINYEALLRTRLKTSSAAKFSVKNCAAYIVFEECRILDDPLAQIRAWVVHWIQEETSAFAQRLGSTMWFVAGAFRIKYPFTRSTIHIDVHLPGAATCPWLCVTVRNFA